MTSRSICRPLHMILSEIDKHRPTSASSHAPKPNTKEKMPTLEVLVSRVDREWARRELRRAAQVQTSPEHERPDTASPTTTQLPQPASHIRSHTIADITGSLSFEPPTPSMRKVLREKNIYASEAHTARLRHARKNIPKPATSWGPGNAKRRARSSHMESEQPCLSAYCAREYSWDYLIQPDFAVPTTSRALQVWGRMAQVVEPIWCDCEPRPPSPSYRLMPPSLSPRPLYSPPRTPVSLRSTLCPSASARSLLQSPLTHAPKLRTAVSHSSMVTYVALLPELPLEWHAERHLAEHPSRTLSSSLAHLEQLSASPQAASRAASRGHPEHPYRDFLTRRTQNAGPLPDALRQYADLRCSSTVSTSFTGSLLVVE